jgi:hypothetical protein
MGTFKGETFENETIKLDGNEYIDCTFRECEFVYAGYGPVIMRGNKIFGYKLTFIDSAQRTLNLMEVLYHGGFKDLIEKTFENIRKGQSSVPIIH